MKQLQSYPSPIVPEPPITTHDPADLLTVGQVAAQLGVNVGTLRSRLRRSDLKVGWMVRQGQKWGRRYYSRADVQKIREALT